MEKIFSTDISQKKEFKFEGDTLRQKECVDEEKHIYVYDFPAGKPTISIVG